MSGHLFEVGKGEETRDEEKEEPHCPGCEQAGNPFLSLSSSLLLAFLKIGSSKAKGLSGGGRGEEKTRRKKERG